MRILKVGLLQLILFQIICGAQQLHAQVRPAELEIRFGSHLKVDDREYTGEAKVKMISNP